MRSDYLYEIVFQVIINRMKGDGHCSFALQPSTVKYLIRKAIRIFKSEPSLLRLHFNPIVVGDLHGDIDSLLYIFSKFGYPPDSDYLFLGDYVDRGQNSIEILLLLYSLKVIYPQHIYILRGNHETKQATKTFGFKDECLTYLDKRMYSLFCKSFSELPISAIINDKIFCVHGGLSPSLQYLSEFEAIEKPIPSLSLSSAEDLLWSDPIANAEQFFQKSMRGRGYLFNTDAVAQFLEDNELKSIIRAHTFCEDGFAWTVENCLTIFSTCDYIGKNNAACVAKVVDDQISLFTYALNELPDKFKPSFPDWLFRARFMQDPLEETFSIVPPVDIDQSLIVL